MSGSPARSTSSSANAASEAAWRTRSPFHSPCPSPVSALSPVGCARALGLEVVGHHGERVAVLGEGLGDRLTGVEPHRLVDQADRVTDGRHHAGPVDDRVADDVAVDGVQLVRQRHVRPLRVPAAALSRSTRSASAVSALPGVKPVRVGVLDLHQRHDLGVQRVDRRHDLGRLVGRTPRRCSRRGRRAGPGEEVVEHVERATCRSPPTGVRARPVGCSAARRRRPRCRRPAAAATRRSRSPSTSGSVKSSSSPTRTGVSGVRYGRLVTLARALTAVVQHDPAAQVLRRDRLRRRSRAGQLGRLHQQPALGQGQLAEAGQVEHLADGQPSTGSTSMPSRRSRSASPAGRSRAAGVRQVVALAVGAHRRVGAGADLGLAAELRRRARWRRPCRRGRPRTRAEHEDAVGRGRVAVAVAVLQVEAAQPGNVADHDAAYGHLPGRRNGVAAPLPCTSPISCVGSASQVSRIGRGHGRVHRTRRSPAGRQPDEGVLGRVVRPGQGLPDRARCRLR